VTGYHVTSAPLPALASITKSAAEPRVASLKGIMAAKRRRSSFTASPIWN
jgi:electron transfer flavoprotein alpha/beta subunit